MYTVCMKKLAVISLVLVMFASSVSAQEIGEKFLKEVTVNGKKVERWVKLDNYLEYNNNGDTTYWKRSDGCEFWYEYDEKNNIIYSKDSSDREEWYEYDKNGNNVHKKVSNGKGYDYWYDYWYEYDENRNLIYSKSGYNSSRYDSYDSSEEWYEYDSSGNLIHKKTSYGSEQWFDTDGNIIHEKWSPGVEIWSEYDSKGNVIHYLHTVHFGADLLQESWYENEYNSNGKLTHVKCLNNQKEYWYDEYWYEYDANEHLIHEKNSDGKEEFYEYDEKGNLTYCRESKEFGNKIIGEIWYEYDTYGNKIYKQIKYNSNSKSEYCYEYTYHPNGQIKTISTFVLMN